ncbi:MAG TPA: class I SAM-dependent methyltransferase [Trebonia sp.]|nr:class I SAM-dependent methyltransferase [Trebonia sp.]
MATVMWSADTAARYDAASTEMFDPEVLGPAVDVLAELADGGPALEFAIGTGRVALPLAERGVPVSGIELSPHMAEMHRSKPGAAAVPVTIGDMATTRVPGEFSLVYLVYNTIENVTTQDEQVAVFANAAAHLRLGGRFLLEVEVPSVPRIQPGEQGRIFDLSPGHVGIDAHDDPVGQLLSSHHWTLLDGQWVQASGQYRYVWPSELDLMARLAGLRFETRWAGWDRAPFTAASPSQVVVYVKPS